MSDMEYAEVERGYATLLGFDGLPRRIDRYHVATRRSLYPCKFPLAYVWRV